MQRRIEGEFESWQTRITLRRTVREAIQALAVQEMRSTASMMGVLLEKALTAGSSA
jgi:hypothetical protein